MMTITFDQSSLAFMMKTFDLSVGDNGFVYRYGELALTINGKAIKPDEIAGMINTKDGLRLIKNNIIDLMEIADVAKSR